MENQKLTRNEAIKARIEATRQRRIAEAKARKQGETNTNVSVLVRVSDAIVRWGNKVVSDSIDYHHHRVDEEGMLF
jgi:ubiquinone biosynthesis protein COQ9